MKRYAELFGRRRPIVAAFVVVMTTLAAFGLRGLEFDDVARDIFEGDDEAHAQLQAFYAEFGSDDNDALVVASGPFSADMFAHLDSVLTRRIQRRH